MYVQTFALFVVLLTLETTARKLPAFVHPCSRNDPDLNDCIKNAVEDIRPHLKNGVQEMHIPPFEPMVIKSAALKDERSFNASFENVRIFGLSDFKINSLDYDLDNDKVDIDLTFPLLRIYANYKIKGKILILQLNGFGTCDGNYTNTKVTALVTGGKEVKKGKEFINYNDIKLDVFFDKVSLQFENLFPGNKELSMQLNKVINENSIDFVDEVKPVAVDTISAIVLNLIKNVFERYSIDQLFRS